MKLIVISGRSGSGKTIALHVLEDLGYECIDGVPYQCLLDVAKTLDPKNNKVAVSLDIRNMPAKVDDIKKLIASLQKKVELEIIYLDAESSELIKRYSETRRLHPLSKNKLSLSQALLLEHNTLAPLKELATFTIDTTMLSVHNLNEQLKIYLQGSSDSKLLLIFQSFGFKHTHPADADYMFDVRFLPNPYWEPHLREYNGKEKAIGDYLQGFSVVNETVTNIEHLFINWLPLLEKNNRNYVTIAIGCTGGKHRSVYICEQLAACFKGKYQVQIEHQCLKV